MEMDGYRGDTLKSRFIRGVPPRGVKDYTPVVGARELRME
jgi:hypothetical protein